MIRIWLKLASLWSILAGAKVHLLKEYLHDVHDALEIMPGNEILIRCCGNVSVNGVPLVRGTCAGVKEVNRRQISTGDTPQWTNQHTDTLDPLRTNRLVGDTPSLPEVTGTADEAGFDWSNMDRSQWTINGQLVPDITGRGGDMKLPNFGLDDVGNYSCYQDGRLISTVTLNLKRAPVLTCRRKAPHRKIRCDWKATQPISPDPHCQLTLKKRGSLEVHMLACKYSSNHSRCRCLIGADLGAYTHRASYIATLNVTHALGTETSHVLLFTPQDVLKPDPPNGVQVKQVAGDEQRLDVSWSHPKGWGRDDYYRLKAELRYRPKGVETYQTVTDIRPVTDRSPPFSKRISDALPHVLYEVQVRVREEHNQGNWSEWSSPVSASTWTAPDLTESPDSNDINEDPVIIMVVTGTTPRSDPVQRPVILGELIRDHVVSIIGCCVVGIVFLLVIIPVVRQRISLKSKLKNICFASPSPGSPLQLSLCETKAQDSPANTAPPQEDLFCPTSQAVHFDNASYFLMMTEPKAGEHASSGKQSDKQICATV
ncbi:hypothetical protein ACEWY4_019702 [Coilia grayii]|uniref:Fibronectin type-III domain-containing protein n=1 Tax=Coilia grayii TaxID=363190 RepID=A0ABD1JAG9_9TELE